MCESAVLSVLVSSTWLCGVFACSPSRTSDIDAYAKAKTAASSDNEDAAGLTFVESLAAEKRAEIARDLAKSRDASDRRVAVAVLALNGLEAEAGPVLAGLVVEGEDVTALGYLLVHNDAGAALARTYVATGRYLLSELDRLDPVKRQRAVEFLSDGGFSPPLSPFSVEAATKRLVDIESRARRTP